MPGCAATRAAPPTRPCPGCSRSRATRRAASSGAAARNATLELLESAIAHDRREDEEATVRITVEQALCSLAEGDRRVLSLRYAEDLTQVEVARRLGVPEGTAKVRLHRARRRLRRLLED